MEKARGGLGYWSGEGQDGRWRWAVQVAEVEVRSAERVRRSCRGEKVASTGRSPAREKGARGGGRKRNN